MPRPHPGAVAAILLSAAFCGHASVDGEVSADDVMVSLLQNSISLDHDAPSGGQRDLVMAYVPYNFGHTVAMKAIKSGIKWGDCGARGSSACLGASKSQVTGCQLMNTPGKYWPEDVAKRYFGNNTVFGILRDPYERLVAQFRGSGFEVCPEARAKCDVNTCVKQLLQHYQADPYIGNCFLLPQAEFFDQPFGATVFVDNRLFPVSMNKLLQDHGYSDLLIRQNDIVHVSGCDNTWAGDLDAETKKLVRDAYKRDFELICEHLGHCDPNEATCLTHINGMCPERLFRWDSTSEVYLKA